MASSHETAVPRSVGGAMVLRWGLVVVGFLAIGILGSIVFMKYRESKDHPKRVMQFTEPLKESLSIRLESSRNLFQVGLLLCGGLWALYLGKTEETKVDLTHTPEVLLFLLCNAFFLVSFFSQYLYADRLTDWLRSGVPRGDKAEVPDVFDSAIEALIDVQKLFFYAGCVSALATFLSGRYLKESGK